MKIISAVFGQWRKVEDEFVLNQILHTVPFSRFEIGVMNGGEIGEHVSVQVRYKHLQLVVTYQSKSYDEALRFVESLRNKRNKAFTTSNASKFAALLMKNSKFINSRCDPTGKNTKRINAPLYTPGHEIEL